MLRHFLKQILTPLNVNKIGFDQITPYIQSLMFPFEFRDTKYLLFSRWILKLCTFLLQFCLSLIPLFHVAYLEEL